MVLTWCASCGSSQNYAGLGADADFQNGKELFENGRCFRAVEVLRTFLSEHPGSARVDDAIFYLAQSHKCLDEHLLARDEFDRVLREFPQSEHRQDAEWQRALTYYDARYKPDRDSGPTEQAIQSLENYVRNYPEGTHRDEALENIRDCRDRLAEKAYENGATYMILKQYDAAILYFQTSLQELDSSSVSGRCLAKIVEAQMKKGEVEGAAEWLVRLEDYATPERRLASEELSSLVEKAGKDAARAGDVRDRLARDLEKWKQKQKQKSEESS